MDPRQLIPGFLLWFLLPVWVLAGIGDYLCHRRTAIERTSGLRESSLHVLQAIEIAIPLLAGLFLQINALVLCLMIGGVLTHSLTALWDGLYTAPRRPISAIEQHIHSHLEWAPIAAVLLVVLLHWDQFAALFGQGTEAPSFAMRAKNPPLPARYLVAVLVPVFLLQGALLAEETLRSWRAGRSAGAG